MPFLGVSLLVEPPVVDPGDPSNPILPNPAPAVFSGLPAITLETSDGTVFDLSNPRRMLALLGRKGMDATPYNVYVDESPSVDGEIFRSARALARPITFPMYVRATARKDFLALKRELLAKMAPTRGLMTLTFAEQDGNRRRIFCYYVSGAEGDTDRGQSAQEWARYTLELKAPDPYWRGDPLHVEWSAPEAILFLGGDQSHFLPFRVQSGQSFGDTAFDNDGDVNSYPVWTIIGPTSGGISLTRQTAGYPTKVLSLSSVLSPSQSITIDTRPDRLSVVDQDGGNRWPDVVSADFWQIVPGLNSINVTVGGFNANTKVLLDAEPRYETA